MNLPELYVNSLCARRSQHVGVGVRVNKANQVAGVREQSLAFTVSRMMLSLLIWRFFIHVALAIAALRYLASPVVSARYAESLSSAISGLYARQFD